MAGKINKKKIKQEYLFLGIGIFSIAASAAAVLYSLTFLVRNINLVLSSADIDYKEVHFNLKEAENLFLKQK